MNTRRIGAAPKEAFWSGLKGGIFDKKHSDAMGSAIWLFGYLVMRQTQLNEQGEGLPRYGNPTSRKDIAGDTGWTLSQIDHWMRTLVHAGYIRTMRTGNDGVVIFIRNAKKKQRVRPDFHSTGSAKSATPKSQVAPISRGIGFRSSQIGDTQIPNKFLNQAITELPTKDLSYSYTSFLGQHTDAAKSAACFPASSIREKVQEQKQTNPSFSEVQRQRQIPRPMTEKEIDQRRRLLLKQGEEIMARYDKRKAL
jgi:DNA-binding MarR family transcriptional regulator